MSRKRAREAAVEDLLSRKSQKAFRHGDVNRAAIFERLSDDRHDTRLQAAKQLLERLEPGVSEDGLDVEAFKDTINRLLRGLCSGRKSARAGFFVALSEVLQLCCRSDRMLGLAIGNVQAFLDHVDNVTRPDPDLKQEARDKMIGRAAAYQAVLHAKLVISASSLDAGDSRALLTRVCALAKQTPWLREECGAMLCEHLSNCDASNPVEQRFAEEIISQYNTDGLLETPEGVALWLKITTRFPTASLAEGIWHKKDPMHSKEWSKLAMALVGSQAHGAQVVKLGSWKPQPNFAWHVVLNQAFTRYPSQKKLRQFWIEIIDNTVFADKASSERKFLGLNLMSWAITHCPADLMSAVFTPHFMRCLINHRVAEDRELFAAANEPLERIVSRSTHDAEAAISLFNTLVGTELSMGFDGAVKKKVMERLAHSAPSEAQAEILRQCSSLLTKVAVDDTKSGKKICAAVCNFLLSFCHRRGKSTNSAEADFDQLKRECISILCTHAYLAPIAPSELPKPAFSADSLSYLHEKAIQSIQSALPYVRRPGSWFASIISDINAKLGPEKYAIRIRFDQETAKTMSTAQKTLKKLDKQLEDTDKSTLATVSRRRAMTENFQLLFSSVLLEVYSGDADAVDMLSDLQLCYSAIKLDEDAETTFDAMLELLLSLLSKSSSFFRQIADIIFPTLSSSISEDGLDSLLDIISKKETVSGQEELFANDDDAMLDQEITDASDLSIDSDVDILSASSDADDNDSIATSSSLAGDGETNAADDAELEQFNKLLAQTLKTSNGQTNGKPGAGADDTQLESESESDLDDEQMMALDPQLAKIFHERQNAGMLQGGGKKKQQAKAKLQMTLFKGRVLDLVQMFAKLQNTSPLSLKLPVSMLGLMRTTKSAELEGKARTVLQTWIETCDRNKAYPSANNDAQLWEVIQTIHSEVLQNGSRIHDVTCSRASLFLAKLIMLKDSSNLSKLMELYGQTQTAWVQSKATVHISFFTEWCGWCAEWKKKVTVATQGHSAVTQKSRKKGGPKKAGDVHHINGVTQKAEGTGKKRKEGKEIRKEKKKRKTM